MLRGADAQIEAVAKSIKTFGLQFAADPSRLFARVTGSAQQWRAALGTSLSKQAATASSPFITYSLPQRTVGYDLASGLGVPNWAVLPATLPNPG